MYLRQTALSTIGILVIFFLPHYSFLPIPFFYTIPVVLIVWLLLKAKGDSFSGIYFNLKRFEQKAIWTGAIAAILLFVFLNYVFFPVLQKLIVLEKANLDDFKNIRHNPGMYVFILIMGWLVGGIYEEIVFHGFIFKGIENMMKRNKLAMVSLLVTNIIFGLYHFQLGLSGMLNAFLAGIAYNALMIKFKRNLWYSVFFHGFFDMIGLTYIYLGYW